MKLLLIDNNDSFTYNLAQIVRECGVDKLEIVKTDELKPAECHRFDKILISPGPGLPKDYPTLYEILKLFSGSKSILGVCLGHQAIAEYFGATLVNLNQVYHGVSKKVNIIKNDYLFVDIPDGFEGGLYHSWAVSTENFPSELAITSVASDGIIMSLTHTQYDIRGIQFHPESIMTKTGKQIIRNWIKHGS